jgi:hypothetical protein
MAIDTRRCGARSGFAVLLWKAAVCLYIESACDVHIEHERAFEVKGRPGLSYIFFGWTFDWTCSPGGRCVCIARRNNNTIHFESSLITDAKT